MNQLFYNNTVWFFFFFSNLILGQLYTGVPVSVLVPLPGPPLHDSLGVQLTIRTFDPNDLGIRTCTDTEVNLAYDSLTVL